MNRPYIICHMVTSLDGKVTGDFLSQPECENACEIYYDINRNLKSNGFICGRITVSQVDITPICQNINLQNFR